MGNANEPALLADLGDRLGGRPPRGHGTLEEETDEIAVGRPALLADDHREPGRGCVAGTERAVDPIVVRDGEVGEAAAQGSPHDGARVGQAVEARRRVAVQVDEDPVAAAEFGGQRVRGIAQHQTLKRRASATS